MRSLLHPSDDWIASVVGSRVRFWLFAALQTTGVCSLVYFTAVNGGSSTMLMTGLVCLLQLGVLAALRQLYRRQVEDSPSDHAPGHSSAGQTS